MDCIRMILSCEKLKAEGNGNKIKEHHSKWYDHVTDCYGKKNTKLL